MTTNTSIPRSEFTNEQVEAVHTAERINRLQRDWLADLTTARAKVAENDFLSSFDLEDLCTANSRVEVLQRLNTYNRKLKEFCETSEETRRILAITNWEEFQKLQAYVLNMATESYMEWYRPNSTSVMDVELKLRQHEAWQTLQGVASGRKFF